MAEEYDSAENMLQRIRRGKSTGAFAQARRDLEKYPQGRPMTQEEMMAQEPPLEPGETLPYLSREQAAAQGKPFEDDLDWLGTNMAIFKLQALLPTTEPLAIKGIGKVKKLIGASGKSAADFMSTTAMSEEFLRLPKETQKKIMKENAKLYKQRLMREKVSSEEQQAKKDMDERYGKEEDWAYDEEAGEYGFMEMPFTRPVPEIHAAGERRTAKRIREITGESKDIIEKQRGPKATYQPWQTPSELKRKAKLYEDDEIFYFGEGGGFINPWEKKLIDTKNVDDKVIWQRLKKAGIKNDAELRSYLKDQPDPVLQAFMERTGRAEPGGPWFPEDRLRKNIPDLPKKDFGTKNPILQKKGGKWTRSKINPFLKDLMDPKSKGIKDKDKNPDLKWGPLYDFFDEI